jgi:hypothetical protein
MNKNYITVKNSKGETLTIVISEETINNYLKNGIDKIVIDNNAE